jgi:hypothetical protein
VGRHVGPVMIDIDNITVAKTAFDIRKDTRKDLLRPCMLPGHAVNNLVLEKIRHE